MNRKKRALITGINGQVGSHMADFLLEKDYEVFGMERRSSVKNRTNCNHLEGKITFLNGDLADQSSIFNCIKECNPDEFYNFAAMSYVAESFNSPIQSMDITGLGVLRCLEAIRQYGNPVKFYQSSSSEIYGATEPGEIGCSENSPLHPRSPYGVAKASAFYITRNYREAYNMFICNGIMFNTEGHRRGLEFVTRKITNGVAKIMLGLDDKIVLGNLNAKRDWSYCPDVIEVIYKMMQQDKPDDYVISTGESHSIKEFLDVAFKHVGIDDWSQYVEVNDKYKRPAEVDFLLGDSSKARKILGWKPKTTFEELVKLMVDNDIKLLGKEIQIENES